jgi:hypothetical protein
MLTITACESQDCQAVAAIWNARRLDASSCWNTADAVDETYIAQLLASGLSIFVAREGSAVVAFGVWCNSGGEAWLVALAAQDELVYYRLMSFYCTWAAEESLTHGFAELGVAATIERTRMDALGVIAYEPIGFDPVPAGESGADRVPRVLRASCEIDVLRAALAIRLGGEA